MHESRYQPYPQYKDSSVEWLGKIPEHWEIIKIKRLCSVRRGASPRPIDEPAYFDENGEYSWVRIADVTRSERYLERTKQRLSALGRSKSVSLEPWELFLSIAGTVGKPIITKIKCCIHDGFVYFISLCENREFLYYIFSCGEPYKGLGKLGTQLNLNTDTIGDIYLPIPESSEQHAIVQFLDQETARIDALIAKKERLRELLREKRTALITHAVTKGLDPDSPMKDSGVEWLGEIPAHWEVKKIKRLCYVRRGASPRPIDEQAYFDEDGEYSWVRIADVTGSVRYLERTKQRLSALGRSKSVSLEPGELFLSIAGTVGKPIITKIKCCIHDGFVYFVGLCENREFLYYIFSCGEPYKGLGKLGTQVNLNTDTIGDIYLPIPTSSEQHAIVRFLDRETARIVVLMAKVHEAIDLLREYRTALISAAVSGRIDVRDETVDLAELQQR